MNVTGAPRFVRYAHPPNQLGYCGPSEAGDLREQLEIGPAIVPLLEQFEGAMPYLGAIASASDGELFADTTVRAYWIGAPVLDRVPIATLAAAVGTRNKQFGNRVWDPIARSLVPGAAPHHSFHVLCVAPWSGLLATGQASTVVDVIDRCRIRCGTVEEVDGDSASVRLPRLRAEDYAVVPGASQVEQVRRGGVPLAPGDLVTVHWDWVCERVGPAEAAALDRWTARSLAIANRTSPALAG